MFVSGGLEFESDEDEDDEDDEVLVLDVELFLVEVTSNVVLESVDFEESAESLIGMVVLAGFEEVAGFCEAAVLDSLLEEGVSEICSVSFLMGASLSDPLDDELSEDEDLVAMSLETAFPVGSAAASKDFSPSCAPLAVVVPFADSSAFDFLVGCDTSSSEDDGSDSDSELGEALKLALGSKFLGAPLTLGFSALIFAPMASFSSSASLCELELEEDPEDLAAFLGFLSCFEVDLGASAC